MKKEKATKLFFAFITRFTVPFIFFNFFSSLASFSQCNNDSDNTESLKILSWNIYMLPHHLIHTGQLARAHDIGEAVKDDDADIIVFEEAFDKKSREIIWNALKDSFPFQSGCPGKNVGWKISSGLWIVSKIPFNIRKVIYFNEAKGSDRFACKGAVMIEAEKNNLCFQLVATHLQSDLEHSDVRAIRHSQYKQIRDELLDACQKKNVPQLIVGDFNTIYDDVESHSQLINTMDANECTLEGDFCYSYYYGYNDFILNMPETPQLLDYILYREQGERKVKGRTSIKIFQKKWNDKHKDLSDHFAISGIITMK